MRVLVTGGAGFIGTHLVRALVAAGHETTSLDLKAPKTPVAGVSYRIGDIQDPETVQRAVDEADAVFHFAALVSLPLCEQRPTEGYRTNLLGTIHVLDGIRRTGRNIRLVFAGSSAVYGRTEGACSERDSVPEPLSLYGAQKLGSEHAIRLFSKEHGIRAVVFRFFNVYGPGQDPLSPYSGVITIFSQALKSERPISLHGGGEQTRDFISVHDVVEGCLAALGLEEDLCDGRPINLGTGYPLSIRELAEQMARVSGSSSLLEVTPPRAADIPHSRADVTRAREILHWEPVRSLRAELSQLFSGESS